MSPLGARWASVFRIAAVIVLVALLGVAASRRQGEPRAFDAFDARELARESWTRCHRGCVRERGETPRDEIVVVRASDAKEDGDEDDDDDDDDASARVHVGENDAHGLGRRTGTPPKTTETTTTRTKRKRRRKTATKRRRRT